MEEAHRLMLPAITLDIIQAEAIRGRFYDHSNNRWEEMGRLEWLLRTIFNRILCCCFSVSRVCERRSWASIAQMKEIPEGIANNINNYFLDSRDKQHPLNDFSNAITDIYAQTICNKSTRDDLYPVQYMIERFWKLRMFKNVNVVGGGERIDTYVSSDYGQIDFYNERHDKVYTNSYDTLYKADGQRVAAVKINTEWRGFCERICYITKILIVSGEEAPLVTAEPEGDEKSFVFREPVTNKILAVASWKDRYTWNLTIVDRDTLIAKQVSPAFLSLTLLKQSQMLLPSPSDLRYVDEATLKSHFAGEI